MASRVFHEGVEKKFVKCLHSVEGRFQPVSCINAHFSLSTPNLSKMKRYSESLRLSFFNRRLFSDVKVVVPRKPRGSQNLFGLMSD